MAATPALVTGIFTIMLGASLEKWTACLAIASASR